MNLNFKNVSAKTWIRTAVLALALINQAFVTLAGHRENINIDELQANLTFIITAVSSIWAWWKNNSFTLPAQKADEHYNLN